MAAFAALLDGGSGDDPLFLQVKEAEASVLERFLGPSAYPHHGQRVVAGQRILQAASDILLGWTTGAAGRQLYVRQLQDQKGGAVVEVMTFDDLVAWGQLCGWALARGHARSGDPVAIGGYLGADDAFDDAIGAFAARLRRPDRARSPGARRRHRGRPDPRGRRRLASKGKPEEA